MMAGYKSVIELMAEQWAEALERVEVLEAELDRIQVLEAELERVATHVPPDLAAEIRAVLRPKQ